MFGCYRRGEANDPDIYVTAVVAVLCHYPKEVVQVVTDPFYGLPGRKTANGYSGMPDVAEVKAACDKEIKRVEILEDMKLWAQKPQETYVSPPPLPLTKRLIESPDTTTPGRRANLFFASDHPRYQSMCDRAASNADPADYRFDSQRGGIWVSLIWDQHSARLPSVQAGAWRRIADEVAAIVGEVGVT